MKPSVIYLHMSHKDTLNFSITNFIHCSMNISLNWLCAVLNCMCEDATESRRTQKGCSISINEDLKEHQPLLLKPRRTSYDAFILPKDNSGTLSFTKCELACPGGTLIIKGKKTSYSTATATCVSGKKFKVNTVEATFSAFTCSSNSQDNKARFTGKDCQKNYKEIEVGFEVKSKFIRFMLLCFDSQNQNTLYSTFNLTKTIGGHQINYPRYDFVQGNFYNVGTSNVNTLYKQDVQRKTINYLLGLKGDSTEYIKSGVYYLARGHLTAKTDYVYGSQQKATFYFVNVAPQWQTLNAGNWKTLEDNVRNYASNKYLDLIVYTGTYGVATLPHSATGKETKLYLYVNNTNTGIPVPKFYWKAVYDPKNKAGVVFVSANNPYQNKVDYICTDVSGKINWLTWKKNDQKSGYSYACDVNDFRNTVTYLPALDVARILL